MPEGVGRSLSEGGCKKKKTSKKVQVRTTEAKRGTMLQMKITKWKNIES